MNKLIAGEGEVKVGSDVICGLETRLSLIQALIPIGLEAVSDVLQQEVGQLGRGSVCACLQHLSATGRGRRKEADRSVRRWGSQRPCCMDHSEECLIIGFFNAGGSGSSR